MRGAWIEICDLITGGGRCDASLPVRGAWIEILYDFWLANLAASLPVRGAWIEIRSPLHDRKGTAVAPRAGSVD